MGEAVPLSFLKGFFVILGMESDGAISLEGEGNKNSRKKEERAGDISDVLAGWRLRRKMAELGRNGGIGGYRIMGLHLGDRSGRNRIFVELAILEVKSQGKKFRKLFKRREGEATLEIERNFAAPSGSTRGSKELGAMYKDEERLGCTSNTKKKRGCYMFVERISYCFPEEGWGWVSGSRVHT